MQQWIASMERMAKNTHWTKENRFDSFAPIRLNVAAQWLCDGVGLFKLLFACILTFTHSSAITSGT